jgi:hypothetical protein
VAEWDDVGGFFGGHNPGNPGDSQHIAFGQAAGNNQIARGSGHDDTTSCHRGALLFGLTPDIDHMRVTGTIEVG